MTTVIVGVDLSDTTAKTLEAVTRLAGQRGGAALPGLTVRLVHVAAGESELAGYDSEPFEANTPDKRAGALRDEHEQLERHAAQLAADGIATDEPVLVMGHTADELLRMVQEFDAGLLVVGSHGHGGLHHLLVGSVTEALLRRSTVPVVVVPHGFV
jgi:nucleotide-binding universal stress UspA family protein